MSDTQEAPDCGELYAALARAQINVHALDKDGTNQHQRYAYTTSESVIDAARKVMAPEGLAAFRADYSVTHEGHGFQVRSAFVVSHPTGARMQHTGVWYGEPGKGRPMDKALAGALTTSLAYWLRDLLLIPRKDDDEPDERDDRDYQPARRQRAPQQQRKQQQAATPAKPKRPAMSAEAYSTALAKAGVSERLIELWRKAVKGDKDGEWNDFRRGAMLAKVSKMNPDATARLAFAAWIVSQQPVERAADCWPTVDYMTMGEAGRVREQMDGDIAGAWGVMGGVIERLQNVTKESE